MLIGYETIDDAVKDYESLGCSVAATGKAKIPDDYAIMLNADESHFFWLHKSDATGPVDWNKWRVLRSAKAHAKSQQR